MLKKLHHVAYRCRDAKETTDFYTQVIGLKFAKSIVQDFVPSIKKEDPHIHIFFEMGDGSFIAFFDISSDEDGAAELDWAQHLALEIDPNEVEPLLQRLDAHGVEYVGPVDHSICQSYYFYDPNGHRLEVALPTATPEMWKKSAEDAGPMLEEWTKSKAASTTTT